MSLAAVLSDAHWELTVPLMPSSNGKRATLSGSTGRCSRGSSTGSVLGIAWRDLPADFGPGRLRGSGIIGSASMGLGRHPGPVARARRRGRRAGLVGQGGLHGQHGPSARHHPSQGRGGNCRITRICAPSRLTTRSAVPGLGSRPRSTCSRGPGRPPGPGRPRTLPEHKAYSSRANRDLLRSGRVTAVIARPSDQAGHRRGSRRGTTPSLRHRGVQASKRRRTLLQRHRAVARPGHPLRLP